VKQVTDFRYGGLSMWVGIGMNKDVYESLPDSVKKVIEEIGPIVVEKTMEIQMHKELSRI
jgi:TRAP-type C4-dicarboxylate transport system substrate-binding protein